MFDFMIAKRLRNTVLEGGYWHFIRNLENDCAVTIVAKKIAINLLEGIDERGLTVKINCVSIRFFGFQPGRTVLPPFAR
ncbi:MAG: hypothetical protein ACI9KN_000295 [Gammaproteobacteria bacterium]|jgi:hypothetical protein